MTPSGPVRIWWDASVAAYRMTSPFNKDLVEAVKRFIPVSDRSFDPQTKVWTFVEKQFEPLQSLLKTINLQSVVVTRQQFEASQAASQSQSNSTASNGRGLPLDTVVMQFVRVVPYDAMRKAYQLAAMALHPDRGGDAQAMSQLNATWARLEKEIYGR